MTVQLHSRLGMEWGRSHTLLVRLGALVSDAACDIGEERLGFADALEINATVLGNCTCSAGFLFTGSVSRRLI